MEEPHPVGGRRPWLATLPGRREVNPTDSPLASAAPHAVVEHFPVLPNELGVDVGVAARALHRAGVRRLHRDADGAVTQRLYLRPLERAAGLVLGGGEPAVVGNPLGGPPVPEGERAAGGATGRERST